MDISTSRHPQPALQARPQVGDDVAKHVVGHNHVKLPRIENHLRAQSVHVHVLRLDLGKLAAYFLEDALP